MTIPSKAVGALSLISCIRDIHGTSMIMSRQACQKATSDTFISNSIGCQKTNELSYKDAKRKNWLSQHNFFLAPNEVFASIGGYLKGVGEGIVRYLPNLALAALSIIPGKNHKTLANISAAALAGLEIGDFIVNGTNATERTDYLK